MESEIKEKQDYLYKEIIEKNYDPEEFQDFIEKKKGLALQLYTLPELIEIVQAFKRGDKPVETEKEESFIVNKISELQGDKEKENKQHKEEKELREMLVDNSARLKESTNSMTKVFLHFVRKQAFPSLYQRIFKKKESIQVKIRSYSKKQQESFFGSTYISYLIQTPQCQWNVERRYKDFQWLQTKLMELLPGYPVPPIPKKTKMRCFENYHLEERMNICEHYLNRLLVTPEICSQEILEQFLRISSRHEFQNYKQKFELKLRSRGNRVQTLKGEDSINKSQFRIQTQEYQFINKARELTHNLNYLVDELQVLLKQATEKSFELSSCFNELYQHMSLNEELKGAEIYDLMSDFSNQLGYKLDGQHCYIHSHIQNYWRYDELYLQNLLGCMTRINKQQFEMVNRYKNLSRQQMDQNNKNSEGHEGKMFLEYQQARELYRLKLSFLKEEANRYFKNDLFNLSVKWASGLRSYMDGVKNLMLSGADQLTKAICVKEGKKLVEVQYITKKGMHNYGGNAFQVEEGRR